MRSLHQQTFDCTSTKSFTLWVNGCPYELFSQSWLLRERGDAGGGLMWQAWQTRGWGWGVQLVSIMSDMMALALSLMREITVSHTVSGSTDKSSARHAGARRWYVDKCREFTLLIDTKRGKRSRCRETSVENNAREQKGGIWREREVSDVHYWHGMSFSVFAFRHPAMIRGAFLWGCQPRSNIDTEANVRMTEGLYKHTGIGRSFANAFEVNRGMSLWRHAQSSFRRTVYSYIFSDRVVEDKSEPIDVQFFLRHSTFLLAIKCVK